MNDHHIKKDFFNSAAEEWKQSAGEQEAEYLMRVLHHLYSHAKEGDRVLDVGCGTGVLFPFLSHFEVTGIDISEEMVRRAKEHCPPFVKEIQVVDVHSLPFDNGYFHHATMLASFPHIDYPEIALAEIRRVLSPHGTLSIIHTAPRDSVNKFHASIGGVIAHDLLPEEAEMHLLITQAGFVVRHQETTEGYFFFAQKV